MKGGSNHHRRHKLPPERVLLKDEGRVDLCPGFEPISHRKSSCGLGTGDDGTAQGGKGTRRKAVNGQENKGGLWGNGTATLNRTLKEGIANTHREDLAPSLSTPGHPPL